MPRFFEFLSLQHSNNNVHNIRLCRLVIANADLSSQELADMRVAEKVKALSHWHSRSPACLCVERVAENMESVSLPLLDGMLQKTLQKGHAFIIPTTQPMYIACVMTLYACLDAHLALMNAKPIVAAGALPLLVGLSNQQSVCNA